ncbi:MAG: protein kinase [Verrucomicrobia bacterium]|nr:protein kinase [Verrucomicrobiota bacterium]MBU4289438.1 protein kinase [Verrucomicrobiota bacterium]MBU4429319.1 protein kinase [Verrucomicrobiota bacterium]MBU4497252.1 protein kinase [Verrucomicrobiota bacterium]MCG2679145.1 protein kinase [Kiritimatiellia bacterium]
MERYKILIVDDEPDLVAAVAKLISATVQADIISTCSPSEAIHILFKEHIALLLCDMEMPEFDGNVVLSLARKSNPNIVSILFTARAGKESVIEAINKGGIWKYLAKPFKPSHLIQMIQEGLQHYKEIMRHQHQLKTLADTGPMMNMVTEQAPPASPSHPVHIKKLRPVVVHPAAAVPSPADPLALTQKIDRRYTIVRLIQEGGSGIVYQAHDTLLDMPVAIKVLSPQFIRDGGSIAALRNEARIAMQLTHKHIVRLHNLQEYDGGFYMVMEYISGCTFRDILKAQGNLPLTTVMQVAGICTDAIGYAHRRNVLHRDIKPDNLMLTRDGVLKVIDFGLACLSHPARTNMLHSGTPMYVSPEEIRGETLDQRSDIFSLAVTLHELLTGYMPTANGARANDLAPYCPVVSSEIPEPIRPILEKALAPDPNQRWNTVNELDDALIKAVAGLKSA